MTNYEKPFVASIDQGTTSTRLIIFDKNLNVVSQAATPLDAICKKPGWVEFDSKQIISGVYKVVEESVKGFTKLGYNITDIKGVGITCQRETLVVWDKKTGEPVHNAIGWQDIRTKSTMEKLIEKANNAQKADFIKNICGLNISTYFSTMKLTWLLDNVPEVKRLYDNEELMFGTVDTWLIYNLTGGKDKGLYMTDVTNASRTMLLDIKTLDWSNELLEFFNIKRKLLPEVKSCSELYGNVCAGPLKGRPLTCCMGDQQASLLGNLALKPGQCKNTYGTGIFILCNTGDKPIFSNKGLLTTVAWKLGANAQPIYALEGSISIGASVVKWFKDNLNMFENYEDADNLVRKIYDDESEVFFVPAFSGLFSPHWDSTARGTILGMTHYTTRAEIIKAGYESMAYQTNDIIDIMRDSSDFDIKGINVDGGFAASKIGMQIQSDILGIKFTVPKMTEVTALGSAIAAGLAVGVWTSLEDFKMPESDIILPNLTPDRRYKLLNKWKDALIRSMKWATD